MADHSITCSMSRSGNVWDNAAMESFFSSLKTKRVRRKTYRARKQARAGVFDYIERFHNTKRRHSTIGYLSPMTFQVRTMKAQVAVHKTDRRPNSLFLTSLAMMSSSAPQTQKQPGKRHIDHDQRGGEERAFTRHGRPKPLSMRR